MEKLCIHVKKIVLKAFCSRMISFTATSPLKFEDLASKIALTCDIAQFAIFMYFAFGYC